MGMQSSTSSSNDPVVLKTVQQDGHDFALVTLNRPAQHNPISEEVVAALESTLAQVMERRQHRAIIVTGAGQSFSSGGDLKGYQELFRDRDRFARFVSDFGRVCRLLERIQVPTLAMVHGVCMAGGMELALSCDLIIVADDARIGDGHLRFSQMPGSGCQRLVQAIGLQRARHWLLTGDLHTADEAIDVGLAVGKASKEELLQFALDEVARICRASPVALSEVKGLVVTSLTEPSYDAALAAEEATAVEYATSCPDAMDGLMAFAEKRAPDFGSL